MDIERLARDIADSVLGPLAEGGPTKIHSDVAPVVGDAAAEEVVEAVVKIKVRLEEAFEGSPQAARLEQFMSDPGSSSASSPACGLPSAIEDRRPAGRSSRPPRMDWRTPVVMSGDNQA